MNEYWLNRRHLDKAVDADGEDFKVLISLALNLWRDFVFYPLHERIVDAAASIIQRERSGLRITTHFVSRMAQGLIELGDLKKGLKGDGNCYTACFEQRLLDVTKSFYTKESEEFLSANTVVDYMKHVETRLNEETYRVQSYLHGSTLKPLLSLCVDVLIQTHMDKLLDTFKMLMQENRDSDLKRLFGLVTRVPNGVIPLCKGFQDFIEMNGRDAIKVVSDKSIKDNDAVEYCEAIIAVHKRFSTIVDSSLSKDPKLMTALDKAMKVFVNDNSVTRKDPKKNNDFSKSPQLLAYYCDTLLKKDKSSSSDDTELEINLCNARNIFCYLEDAIVFMGFYQSKFAARLVNDSSASDEAERSMISKLLDEKGYEYTSRLNRMWVDIGVSKEMNVKFRKYRETAVTDGVELADFSVLLLTSGSWPLKEAAPFTLPNQLEECRTIFTKYYTASNQGRKLQWLTQQGVSKGELKTGCFKKSYTLTASTPQMAILMLFNKRLDHSFDDLTANTGMSKELLSGNVDLLVKMKILNTVGDSKVYTINKDYKYKANKVKIDIAIKSETDKDEQVTLDEADADKELLRQLVIVRLMKMRKVLSHNDLITQAILQLSKTSNTTVRKIQLTIEGLIEKEYMKRSLSSEFLYEYIA